MPEEVALYLVCRGSRELLYMTPVGNYQFRLEVTSIGGHLRYGDTIEVGPPLADGAVPYRKMIRRSGLRTQCFVLSKKLVESPGMREFAKRIEVLGGHCEGIAGGVLVVHLPRRVELDIQQELKRIQQNLK